MKRSIPQLVSFLVLCLFSLPGISQTITLDFPNDLEVCEDMVTLDVTVLNDTGSDIDTGMIAIDLSAIAGVTYLGFTQTAGPTITEDVAGVPNFSFDPLPNPLPDGMSLTFSLQLMTDCTTAASAAPAVTLNFDYRSILMDFSTSETLSGITIIAPDIEITSSAPIGITGVIGYEFAITNTVENNGTADAENVYYCVEDNTNATLQSLEVGMTSLAPVAGVMPGFTCFDLSVLPQAGMVDVVENWVITSCSAPIQNLFRRASYGCNMDFDCSEEPDSDFPSTVLTLAAPALPIAISITNASELSVCGVVEIVCIDIENIAGSGFVTRNTKVAFQVPAGLGIDLSALVNKSGPPVSVIPGTDSLLIGDFEDNEITSFSLEVQAICGAESNALDFIVDVVYDELCEGEATIVSETSNQISILSALFTILSSEIEGNLGNDNVFDAILGEVDTLKVPLNNASSGSIDSFVYYVVNPGPFVGGVGPVEIENVLIEGVPLEVLGTNGDTTFYAITGPNILDSHSPGGLGIGMTVDEVFDENEQLIICEVWRGTRCEFGTIDPGIQRQAYYGCGGVEACSRSNLSVSGVNYSFAAPDLTYSEYKDLSVRPACYSDESTTLGSKIVNIGNSIAKDITISIDQGGRPGVILGGSFMYSSSPTGPFISVPAINTVGPIASSCLSGPGRFNEADAFLEDINLPAGDSIYFTYDLEFGCDCSACSIQDIYGSTITQMQFTDPCDLEFVNNDNIDYIDFDARLEGFFEGESLVSGSSCFTYQITSGTASWMRNRPDLCMGDDFYPDAYFESVFVVDCGIDITSVTYTDNDGVESADLIVSNVDKGAGGQDSVVTRIPYNVAGTFNICFNLDCDEKGPCTQTASIRLDNYFITADCPSGCAPNVNCTDVFTTSFGCPGCLPCDGLSAVDLEINRTNYCYLDADDDFIPDDGSLADQTTAKSKRFVQGDSLRLEIISVIRDEMGPASFWDYAFLELDVQATDYTIVGGEFSVYDSSSMATLTCNSLSQFDDSGTFVTDVSVPSMTGLGCIDFAGFHYAEGDSLCLTVIFSPKDELFNVQSAPVIYSPIFYLSDAPYGMGSRESCNNLFETLNQIGITEREIVSIEGRDFGGCDLSPFVIRYDLHYGSLRFDEFCGEIRSPGIPEKFTFVKPSELEYSLDDFGMNVLQRMDGSTVVNQQSGGIPPGFFLESGDTLCFFVKDYLATLPDGELTDKGTDGGYSINFYPGIRGNCMTDSELMYEAGAQLITDVDDQVFCQDTIMTALEFESFEYTGGPVLVASTSMPNVELLESSACVEIELTNLTLINAPFSWIDIQSMTGGLIVTSVTETTGGMSNVITPSQFGIYELGTTADEATRTFEICVNTTNCDPQTLSFVGGWDCSAYPETLEEATCNDPSTINFTTAESAYTGQLVKPTIGEEYDLCDTICFIYRISSNSFGNINDIIYDFRLPGGVDYVHGSFEIAYPVPTTSSMLDTNWVFVTDPANTFDNNYQINVSDLDMTLMNDGLIGTFGATTNTNIILVRWNAVTTCDFISGSRARFSVNAKDACNDDLPTLRSRGPRMRIRNLFPDYEINLSSTDLTLNPCNEDGATTNIQMQISADPGIETSDMDSIKITLPEGISYQAMSYNPITNATAGDPLVVFENDSTCLYIPIQEGLENGDFVSFDIDIVANDVGQLCGNYEMIVQTFSSTNAMCGMEECSIGVLSGEDFINISIEKPDLSIITTDLTIVSMPPASAGIDYEIKIMNNGLVPQDASNNLNIEFWDDVDANGLLDPMIDDLVIVTSEIVTIPAGGMTLITGSSPIPPTGICQALVVLNPESTCVCNLEVSNQTSVTIENMFDMEVEVCSGAMVDIGPELVAGFDYKWLSVNGSNLGALSSETTSPTTLQFTNNTGSDIVWDYAVRSSYGSCYTYDTVQVTIFPATMSEATVTACLDGSVALPGPVDGFDFMWTPITGLDDPTSNSPILDPVLMGVNTYNLSYIDGNGCGASKEVIIVGAGCTDGTAIGDTVWFDFNEDGLQDPGEPGIPNVTVYLYTASNTTPGNHIAFTMTDANGFYIFDNLTAGNYIIEFVSPSGFVYTLDNVVGNDSLDSDPDPGTGLTGPYYLPNGTYDPTVDAGFIPDCLLEVTISEVSECMFTDPGQEREILVDITWNNAVYTYDFLGGVDTIQLDILGQTFQYEIDTLNGDTSQLVIMDASTTMDILAEVSLLIDDDCITTDEILDVIACTYDVALIKEVVDFPPYMYGDILTYNITVQNQGEQDVNNVVINDFLPSGFVFDAGANPDWVETTFDTLTYTIDDTLVAGETRIIPLMLELVMSSEVGAYLNTSEIGSFQDTTGMDRSDQDIDSAPDNDPTNDGGGAPNSGSDNTLDGDGSGAPGSTNPNTDEDDQDPELITIVDLALVKRILTPGPYNYGDPIEFEITVYNQGNVTASNVAVIDYIPAGFSFDPVNMPNWMLSGSNAIDTIPGPLMTGDSASTTITLILEMADPSEYVNVAEIFYFENDDGFDISGQDIDSDADQTNGNDAGGNPGTDSDNVANGDGTGSAGGTDPSTDEDDSDPAYISVPMIDVEKTTTSIVPAQSGIDGNFDATFELVITNPGNIKLTCILLQDDLAEQLGGTFVGLAAAPITIDVTDASEVPPIVMGYNGGVIDTIFSGVSGCLRPGETITIELVVEVNSLTGPEPIINEANVSGKDTLGIVVMDKDTALVATPDCFLSVICPIDQVDLKCLNELPPAGTTAAWFNAIDGISSIENACGTPTIVVNDTDNGGAGCVTDTLFVTRQIIVNDPGDGTTVPQADTCEILYTIVDDVKPIVMNTPIDLVLECGVDNTAAIMDWEMTIGGAAIVDECGALTITFVEETPITECGGTSRTPYTLTATDACGNFVTRTANLILIDTQDPVLTLPTGASTVSCDAGPDADAWAATASAMDENSCDSAPTVSYSLINVVESCAGTTQNTTYTYLFTAVDACGNESESMTADYVITDAEAPTLTAPPTLNITCGQDISLLVAEWLDDVVLDDNCDDASDLVVTNDYDATALLDACGATIPVTWTITDDCGGTSTAMANIVIAADATGPTMTCVPTLTFAIDVDDCGANLAIPLPTATDCNGVASIVQTSPAPNTEFSIGSTIVTFTATDNCGNESTCTTNVIVEDTQNPELLCPPSINRCATAGTCTWTSDASVNPLTSDCGATTLTYSVANADGSTSTPAAIEGYVFMLGSSVVTVTSTDNADPTNATMCSFTVTITDCEAPSMTTCPAPQTMVECGMEDVATWAATLVGTDFCDATLTESYYILSQEAGCGLTSTTTYVFVVTDDSGNQTTCTSTYTIVDNTPPMIDTPASNPMVSCMDDNDANFLVWLGNNGGAVSSDDCNGGPVVWTNDWDGTLPSGCAGSTAIMITFTATDDCGNPSETIGTYTITDGDDPTLNLPDDLVLECGNINNEAIIDNWLASVTGDDACSAVMVTNNYAAQPLTCNVPVIVTFTGEDECGNMITGTRTITLQDITKPVIMSSPLDLIVECGVDNTDEIDDWVMDNGGATAIDECDAPTITFVAQGAEATCGSTTITPYLLTVTDACGNFVTRTANLILVDTQDPTLILPTGASTVSCDAGPDADAWAAAASATDDCDASPTVSYSLINVVESCAGTTQNTTYTYLFTAVDACGNESESMTADYVITDAEAPTLTPPPTLNITCGQDISLLVAEWLDDVVLDDNCDDSSDLVVTNDYDATALFDACGATIAVTWTITDDCGGTSTTTANIVIADDLAGPTMTCIPTLTFAVNVDDCGANLAIPLPTATDCNGVASIVQTSPAPNTEFSIGSTIVTFTATDNCGNESTCTTEVIVEDTQNPELLCPPSINRCATAGTCTWTSDASVNPLTSDCGATTLTYSVANADGSTSTPAAIEGYVFMLGSSVVTVTSTDNADPTNATMCSFTVTITDCEAPTITTCPAPQTMVECGMEDVATWAATLVGTDFCDATLTESYYILSQEDGCGLTSTTTYVFVVTDDSGNQTTCTSTYTIVDNTPPMIDTPASNPVVSCMGDNDANFLAWLGNNGGAVSSDDCNGGPVVWTNDWDGTLPSGCAGSTAIMITFTATDDCGNPSETIGTYTITDGDDPTLNLPDDLVLECGNINNEAIIDNWLASVTGDDACSAVMVTNNYAAQPLTCNVPVIVTFTGEDECGNMITGTRTITLNDFDNPVIVVSPVDTILECGSATLAADIATWVANLGGAVSTDNCATTLTETFVAGTEVEQCGGTSTTPYTYTVMDECGNETVEVAYLYTIDVTPPVAMCVAPFDLPLDENGQATLVPADINDGSTDLCSDASELSFAIAPSSFNELNIGDNTVELTVTDDCGNSSTCTTVVTVTGVGQLGLAKRIVNSEQNSDGSVNIIYEFNIENYGNVELDSLQLIDDLATIFTPCAVDVVALTSGHFEVNPGFNGISNTMLLTGNDDIAAGEKGAVLLEINVNTCGGDVGPFMNTALVMAEDPDGTPIEDISSNGSDPDTDGDGNPNDDNETTDITFDFESFIGLAKSLEAVVINTDGSVDVDIRFIVENYGNTDLDSINLFDDVAMQFMPCDVEILLHNSSPGFAFNTAYDGGVTNDTLLTGGANGLLVGESGFVFVRFRFTNCGSGDLSFCNQGFVTAIDPLGTVAFDDLSQSGTNPDPDGDGDPTNNDACTEVQFGFNPAVGIAKRVSEGPTSDGMGCFDVTYEIRVENYGDQEIAINSVVDDLSTTFALADTFSVISVESEEFMVNPLYDGVLNQNLVLGGDTLGVATSGDEGVIYLKVNVCPGEELGPYMNQATVVGVSLDGTPLIDASQDGSNPDPDNEGDATDNNELTPVSFEFNPSIGAAKRAVSVDLDADGCTEVVYEINIENFGDVLIDSVQVVDDLDLAGFDQCGGYTVTLTSDDFIVNSNYNGSTDSLLLTGLDDLPVGDVGAILLTVEACGCPDMTEITNSATVSGVTPAGEDLEDDSVDGSDPDGEDNDDNPDEDGETVTTLTEMGSIGAAKREVGVNQMPNGCTEVEYEFNIENFGNVNLDSVQLSDDLVKAGFSSCDTFYITGITSDDFTVNTAYDGSTDTLLLQGGDDLPVGDKGAILLKVEACGCEAMTMITNSSTVTANTPAGDMVSDESTDGSDPDGEDGDGIPDEMSTTETTIGEQALAGLAKRIVSLINNSDGSATVTYEFNVENFGSLDIDSLQVVDSLSVVFDPCNEINVVSITSDDYTVNGAYNGTTDNEMLLGDDVLRVNDKGAILLVVNIGGCAGNEGPFFNTAIISGNGPGGDMVIDSSQQGSDPDPDGDFDPTNNNDPTVTMFEFNSFIGLAKNLVSVVNNADASATVTFEFLVENFGDQGLSELQITDDLLEAFDPCSTISVIDITSPNLIVNDMYNGTTILNLLVPVINDMDPGEENGITLTVNVSDCNGATGPFFNTAVVTSLDESGEMVIDSSQNGTNPDPDGDGDPTDNNVPTPIDFEFNPGMGVSKRLTYGPILSTEGCYDIRFEMRVQNYGDVDLYDIQVLEDLDEVFGAGDIWSVISIESEEFEVNDMFDGIGNINLLNGNDTLTTAVGGNEGAIYLSLNVCPDGMTNPYMNTAIGTSSAPGGQMLQDSSQNGSNPDPDGDGDPTDNNDPTVFQLECEIPMFTNCPRPAINVDAPEGWCTAFVNFSSPEATAECGLDTIIQVDGTGLNSGELFPVGLTTLKWIAIDVQGNESDTCIIKIFVNDFHTAPVIVCPEDMTVTNDPFECGAAVDSLGLVSLVDNCSDNTAVIYEITDEDGNIVSCGMGDASDAFFPKGLNTLTYRVQDQPLLLITEVNQEGPDMIEITNFGPAGINVECLQLTRNASISDSIIILGGLVLQAGEVAVFTFATDIGDNDPAGYTISTQGAILDAVSLNGFSQDGFTGLLSGRAFYRNSVCDHDTEIDWTSAFCETSMGMLNPGLVAAPSNGTITSLQSSPPSIAECSVSVTVLDEETPQCAEYLFSEFTGATATIDDVGCGISTSTVTVAGINSLGTVEIRDLLITHPNVGDLTATLISPEGTRVELFDGLCATTADVNVSLSDTSAASINSAACTPLGSGAWYTPSGFFGDFYGEDGNGIWTLEVVNVGTELGSVTSWNLDILELVPYSQMDTTLNNDEGLCGAEFMWNHPVFQDNCQNGTITVVYTSEDGSPLPMGGVVVSGDTITEFFPVGTTTVTYTLTDASGNMNVCGFDVIVLDAEDPMNLVCPADMIIDLESGECCRVLNFPFPSVTDNCGIDTVIYSTGNNVEYCVGISEVTLTVFDAAGNMASCDFTVTVNPFIDEDDPITFICYGNVNLSLDGDCMSEITADLLINVGTHGCLDNYCIVTIDENGDTIPDNIVTLEHVGQQLEVSVIDCLGTGNSCWGIVNVENKIDPDLECPADITIDCLSDANDLNLTGTALLLTCETDYDLTYADLVSDLGECKEPRYSVVRTWTLVNDEGKRASCEQLISLRPFDFADLKWPANFTADSSLSCSEVAANPLLTEPASTGYPTINGENIFGDHYCDVYVGYWDEVLQDANCTSGYSILRHWIIQNACLPLEGDDNPVEYIQNIIVQDYTPPVLSAFKDVTISTDLWGCKAVYRLPIPEVTDNCSSQDQIKFTYSSIGAVIIDSVLYANKPIVGNTVEVTVWATDACKNTSSTSFKITVKDEIPPVVVADADLVVSLGADGLAKVRAISFDDGSFDGCGPVSYAVRRVDGGATCPILDESLPVGNDNEQLNEFVLFCCDDIGKDSLMVEFQVCDDANQDGILGGSGDLCNSVMVAVEVQDKLPPALLCPPPMTISCIDFYAVDLTDFARLDSLFGSADAFGSCSVIVTQSVLGDEFCGSGEIIRRIVATNDAGQNACNQTITVNAEVVNQLTCNRISFAALDNNIYSWCDVNDNGVESSDLPALEIDCDQDYTLPELKIDLDGLCTEAGVNITVDTFMFAGDACRKYLVHYEVIDQCIYKENYFNPATNQIDPFVSENGYFEFYIEIDAFDNEGPMLACEEVTIETQSCVGYDGAITIEATDKCTEAAFFGIQWKLDVNNDGTYDFPASGFATTREITPAQVGLELFPLGTHSVTWVFTDGCGNSTSCDQVITIEQSDKAPTPYCYGGIASTVLAEDGSYSIWAVDFDAGSADGCASDLVFSLLPETYAEGLSDDEAFNVSLTHPDVIKIDEGSYGFSLGCANIPNGVSAEIPVRMYVSNQKGSYDFCSSTLRLADNSDICEDVVEGALSISGQIKTEFGAKVDSVIMALDANFVEFPYFQNTDQNGTYLFRLLHSMIDYEVEPSKNYKHRNGVTTLDLVLLQRHILGIDRLTSPYKLIAGDVNSDCKISAQDLLQLRKLILGLYADDVLPHNQSWRFVAEDFAFQESEQPCSYEELSTMISMTTSSEEDFIGVKIGDVNNSVEVASRKDVAKRSKGSIDILVNDRVFKKGEEVQVDLYASDFSEVFGFQFSIGFENLLYSDMEAGQVDLNAQNLSERFIDADQLVFSYGAGAGISVANDSILFSLNFIATSDGLLSESLSMSDFRLNPEVYKDSDLSVYVPTLRFNTVDEETLVFDVSQNIPNPFIDRTKIGFTIPEQGDVTLTVLDIAGKKLLSKKKYCAVGENEFVLYRSEVDHSGVLYYQISIGDHIGGKTMIVINKE